MACMIVGKEPHGENYIRCRIDLIQEATAVILIEDTYTSIINSGTNIIPSIRTSTSLKSALSKAPSKHDLQTPRMFLMRLNIHNLHQQDITRLSSLNLKGPRQVMDASEINILHIIRTIIIS